MEVVSFQEVGASLFPSFQGVACQVEASLLLINSMVEYCAYFAIYKCIATYVATFNGKAHFRHHLIATPILVANNSYVTSRMSAINLACF